MDPAAPGLIPSIPQKIREEKIVNVAEENQRRSLEESRQWFENVDRTHLVLAGTTKNCRKGSKFCQQYFPKFVSCSTKVDQIRNW